MMWSVCQGKAPRICRLAAAPQPRAKRAALPWIVLLCLAPAVVHGQSDSARAKASFYSGYVNLVFTQQNSLPLNARYENGFVSPSVAAGVSYSKVMKEGSALRVGMRLGNVWSEAWLGGVQYRTAETRVELPVGVVKFTTGNERLLGASALWGVGVYVASIIEQRLLPAPVGGDNAQPDTRNGPFAYCAWGATGDAGLRLPVSETKNAILGVNVFWDFGTFLRKEGVTVSAKKWSIGIYAGTEF